jgi:hypothetical protein
VSGTEPCAVDAAESSDSCVSGGPGAYPKWTPLPANFRDHGYLVLGSGKYYHDGCGGLGGASNDSHHPSGQGAPPLADRALSWSDVPVQWPNQTEYFEKWGHVSTAYGNFEYLVPDDEKCTAASPSADYCTTDGFSPTGDPDPARKGDTQPLADYVTFHDAVTKLRYAAGNRARTGQPFFQVRRACLVWAWRPPEHRPSRQVMGIKRPHLKWRTPAAFAEYYPAEEVSRCRRRRRCCRCRRRRRC